MVSTLSQRRSSSPLSLPESAFEKDKLKQERDNLVFKACFYQKSIDKDTTRKGRLIDEIKLNIEVIIKEEKRRRQLEDDRDHLI